VNVLALYDIHGNRDALDAVLADSRAADPDVVLVGGDTVPGPFARETLARLKALSVPVHWVRGNGEREVPRRSARPLRHLTTGPPGRRRSPRPSSVTTTRRHSASSR
jgi:predicted phosphodiesterase